MKCIFLDVDGVIKKYLRSKDDSFQPCYGTDRDAVRELNRVIASTGAVIVVTSCYRIGRTVDMLRDLFHLWGVVGVIHGKTCSTGETRGQEIQMYLDANPEIDRFAIIDDSSDGMTAFKDKFIQTKFEVCLTEELADKAIQLLS